MNNFCVLKQQQQASSHSHPSWVCSELNINIKNRVWEMESEWRLSRYLGSTLELCLQGSFGSVSSLFLLLQSINRSNIKSIVQQTLGRKNVIVTWVNNWRFSVFRASKVQAKKKCISELHRKYQILYHFEAWHCCWKRKTQTILFSQSSSNNKKIATFIHKIVYTIERLKVYFGKKNPLLFVHKKSQTTCAGKKVVFAQLFLLFFCCCFSVASMLWKHGKDTILKALSNTIYVNVFIDEQKQLQVKVKLLLSFFFMWRIDEVVVEQIWIFSWWRPVGKTSGWLIKVEQTFC